MMRVGRRHDEPMICLPYKLAGCLSAQLAFRTHAAQLSHLYNRSRVNSSLPYPPCAVAVYPPIVLPCRLGGKVGLATRWWMLQCASCGPLAGCTTGCAWSAPRFWSRTCCCRGNGASNTTGTPSWTRTWNLTRSAGNTALAASPVRSSAHCLRTVLQRLFAASASCQHHAAQSSCRNAARGCLCALLFARYARASFQCLMHASCVVLQMRIRSATCWISRVRRRASIPAGTTSGAGCQFFRDYRPSTFTSA